MKQANQGWIRYGFVLVVSILAISLGFSATAWGAGTPAGTVITNQAFGNYSDANGNARPQAQSNIVSTTVRQVASVDVAPNTAAANVALGSSVNYAFTAQNLGNGPDTLNVAASLLNQVGSGTWTTTLYQDTNRNGILDAGETTVITNTGRLLADSTFYGILKVTTPSVGVNGDQIRADVTATSRFDNTKTDTGQYTSTINAATVAASKTASNTSPQPGQTTIYAVTTQNTGSDTAYSTVIKDNIPSNMTYVAASIRRFNGGVGTYATAGAKTDAADADSIDFNVTNAGAVTFTYGKLAPGTTVTLYFQVQVNADVPVNTIISNTATIDYKNVTGTSQPTVNGGPTTVTVAQKAGVDIATVSVKVNSGGTPSTTGAPDSLATSGNPADSLLYRIDVTNTGNGSDRFNITKTSSLFPSGATVFYIDANNNGIIDAGDTQLTDTNSDGTIDTGLLAQFGVIHLIAREIVPAGSDDATLDITTVTATSVFNSGTTDQVKLKSTVTAPILTLSKTRTTSGTVTDGTQAAPGDTIFYQVVVSNVGTGSATAVVILDNQPSNTTYQANSVTIQVGAGSQVAKTDANDGDEVQVSTGNITTNLGTLAPGAQRTIRFKVRVN